MAEHSTRSPSSRDDVSTVRLYAMRALYLLNFVLVGSNIWPQLIKPSKPLPLMEGVALSFYAALSTLSLLGLRYPLKMVPLLFVQLFYKSAWLLAIAIPLSSAGTLAPELAGAVKPFVIGVVLDLLVIPWPYVVANYLLKPGDRWKSVHSRAHADVESAT
jgi:hypothetical protein